MAINIIGHFGANKEFCDGQTVKTRTVYNALVKRLGEAKVKKTDTYYVKHNKILFLLKLVIAVFRDKKFIVLLSFKGRKVLFPILYYLKILFRKKIYHYTIGGVLADEVATKRNFKKYVASFDANWVESRLMEKRLKELGVNNALFVPNFKQISILDRDSLSKYSKPPFKFCTFSRVMKEKGIESAVYSIMNINKQFKKDIVLLDIYGPIDDKYYQEFNDLKKIFNHTIKYKGVIKPENSVSVLKDYFMLLFPTLFTSEGMPGTIIDAMCAGLPVIASDWTYAREMLVNGNNALIFDFYKPELLEKNILYAINNYNIINDMKEKCLQEACKYSEEKIMDLINAELNK